ncbi:uncharacterized protein DDB_G0271670-like isoform X2 [Frankliniella occidentalis]|uniref:Uncharacterized protein DDB_G0271670-like isoform X2 n=1 Tax=Frankliniella occidentalis TaxID=133901 RepID=A0A9C6U3W0_FRAOC|nr:uncharacterized protein DDB_G0271670-like isoform X2 [Frankliniella occidentalis]
MAYIDEDLLWCPDGDDAGGIAELEQCLEAATVSQSKASSDSQLQGPNGPATNQTPQSGSTQQQNQQQTGSSTQASTSGASQGASQSVSQPVPQSVPQPVTQTVPQVVPPQTVPQEAGAPPRTPPGSLTGLGELTQQDLSGLVGDGNEDDPEDLFQQLGDSHFELDNFFMAELEEKVRQAAEPNFKEENNNEVLSGNGNPQDTTRSSGSRGTTSSSSRGASTGSNNSNSTTTTTTTTSSTSSTSNDPNMAALIHEMRTNRSKFNIAAANPLLAEKLSSPASCAVSSSASCPDGFNDGARLDIKMECTGLEMDDCQGSLPPSPADSGVSDVDSSSSGHTSNDELRARLHPTAGQYTPRRMPHAINYLVTFLKQMKCYFLLKIIDKNILSRIRVYYSCLYSL